MIRSTHWTHPKEINSTYCGIVEIPLKLTINSKKVTCEYCLIKMTFSWEDEIRKLKVEIRKLERRS